MAIESTELEVRQEEAIHNCSKGWAARCSNAKRPRCKCKCGGHNHGNPQAKAKAQPTLGIESDLELTHPQFQPIGNLLLAHDPYCRWCEAKLTGPVYGYQHSGGVEVPGLKGRWWLYLKCPKCGYDWALWKVKNLIGVGPRAEAA